MSLSDCVNRGFLASENKLGSFSIFFMFAFYGYEFQFFFYLPSLLLQNPVKFQVVKETSSCLKSCLSLRSYFLPADEMQKYTGLEWLANLAPST